ncbi:protocatechuate 3,4-dioxygenase subunit alpha [uncultured Tateyamaria sp.]|uniref:protocatechuate 3,4-dioxygenase subunit alpha n=1 Tax=uncultured Tateyamaria sp. TaxID=455651 RepID=UPI00260CCF6C|nr:protocatechuate 3,4-dioxygenase subunit alpha [uncultured Tateyamaria sp.]
MQRLTHLHESPSQTAGPYVHIGCVPNFAGITDVYEADLGAAMVTDNTKGERITVTGTVFDGTGTPLRDAMMELWQADAQGLYPGRDGADPTFTGWGRTAGDAETGQWSMETVRPGPVPFTDGRMMAPHISIWLVARGINIGLQTRMYFPGDPMLGDDPWLTRIEHQNRVPTLIAQETTPGTFKFDIHLQGPDETIFFDV